MCLKSLAEYMLKVGADSELGLKHRHYLKLHTAIIIHYAVAFWGEVKAIASRRCYFCQVLRMKDLLPSPQSTPPSIPTTLQKVYSRI